MATDSGFAYALPNLAIAGSCKREDRCEIPDPHFTDIAAEQALALIVSREQDLDFVVVDVRTALEYSNRHIIGALKIDYYSSTFASDLDVLDKNNVYLIHCASGNRSGHAHDTMLGLDFHEVYRP